MSPRKRTLACWLPLALAKLLLLVTALLVGQAASAQDRWPREIKAKEGKVVIYQPQLESFQGDKVTVLAAVSVQKTDMKAPVFGVVWFESRIATDRDKRMVEFQEIKVTQTQFPNAQPEQERRLAAFLNREIAAWPKPTMALDRLLANLAEVEKAKAGANFNNTPPKIIFATTPSVLVLIDGQPILREVEGSAVKRVVNTPFVLLFDPIDSKYYLTGDALWFVAADVKGPWRTLESPPAPVAGAARKIAEAEVPTKAQAATLKAEGVPQIVVAIEPTELIVTDGAPQFAPLESTDLLYLSNTGRDVFQTVGAQQYYVLLSGRWFTSPSLESGPWAYVAPDKLPAGFYRIPPASVKGHVLVGCRKSFDRFKSVGWISRAHPPRQGLGGCGARALSTLPWIKTCQNLCVSLLAFVPDTPQAKEAVAKAQIPVTTAISRKATVKVRYDGAPEFRPIESTSLQYAVNTTTPVIIAVYILTSVAISIPYLRWHRADVL